MACARCLAARRATARAAKALSTGKLYTAAAEAKTAASEIKAKVAESDRIRALTRRKPHG